MNLEQIIEKLQLKLLTDSKNFSEIEVSAGYTSDLLSCVMAGAKHNAVWVTLQSHVNIIAVAALLELAAIIITESAIPSPETIQKANEQSITLLSTPRSTFEVDGMLWEAGLRAS